MGQTVVVVGSAWGDEGKGKITNYFSDKADLVVRYQGGDNAGHTIVFGEKTYKLHIVPSGIFNPEVKCVLGNGCVINPEALISELELLKKDGFSCENLFISSRAQVLFDHHRALDALKEKQLGDRRIGTTKKGIGPCYTDKIARTGIRVCDWIGEDFKERYRRILEEKNRELVLNGEEPIDFPSSYEKYRVLAETLRPYVSDTVTLVNDEYEKGSKILFEGAQGTLLDIDFGTYPYVTSSNPSAGGVCSGSGLGPTAIHEIVGVTKAYATRVGEGPFPTEMENNNDGLAQEIRLKANEFGATTKRARRIGWFDAVLIAYSRRINSMTGISLMLLDVLSGIEKLKICDYYLLDGKRLDAPSPRIEDFARCRPHYIELDGWKEDISQVRSFDELPLNCRKYILEIEKRTKVPVVMFSVGPDKYQTIVRKEVF